MNTFGTIQPPLPLLLIVLVYFYGLHISEGKVIKTKLPTKSKTVTFFNQQYEHRSSDNEFQGT